MKKGLIILAIALVIGIPVFSIGRQIMLLKKYCFNMAGYKLITINKDLISFEVDIEIKNNSDLTVELANYNLDVFLNGIKATTVASTTNQVLKPKQFSPFTLLINVKPADLSAFKDIGVLTSLLLDFRSTMVKISGTMGIVVDGIKFTSLPVNIQSPLKDMLPAKDQPTVPCV